ncbi:hypothetical protein JB92DRAFT_2732129 [Gautieria morchelliformis]|nr:hypothetical protein JB92DRAFT_2732129 [Gautieria morchelliformis]
MTPATSSLTSSSLSYVLSLSNSYDFFMREEMILESGAQRIHEPHLLIEKMRKKGIEPSSMQGYVDTFRPSHGWWGTGLEREIMLFLKLDNIRRAS